MKIYKYILKEFRPGVENYILMEKSAKILTFKIQRNTFYETDAAAIWAIIDETKIDDTKLRTFILYFTGDSLYNKNDVYINTDIDKEGLVWHCFERFN